MEKQSDFKLLSSSCENLTLERAMQFRDMLPSPTERNLDARRVRHLRQKMEDDLAITFHWATAMINGKEVRMNGQHSSTMLCELNGAFPEGVYVHLDKYEVSSEMGMAMLFRQFDDKKSSRTSADVASAYQGIFNALRDVNSRDAKLGIQGVGFYRGTVMELSCPNGDDLYTLFSKETYWAFLIWLDEVLSKKTNELRKPAIAAAMYATYKADEVRAKAFWKIVASGGIFEDAHPGGKLDAWLCALGDITDRKKRPLVGQIYQTCIFCFNAFVNEKLLKSVDAPSVKTKGFLDPITP